VNFLNHLEAARGNGAGSRNIRLAAIKSFMHQADTRLVRPSSPRKLNRFWMPLIDATVFENNSHLYMVWSGWEGDVNGAQNLYTQCV
jgi:hypothetical protein